MIGKALMSLAISLLAGAVCFGQSGQVVTSRSEPQVDQLNARRAEMIEAHFRYMMTELQLRSERQIQLLEVAEQTRAGLSPSVWLYGVETVLRLNGYSRPQYDGNGEDPDIAGKRLAAAMTEIAKMKRDIIARTELEAASLERQMQAALRNVEMDKSRRSSPALKVTPRGVVRGILYSADKPAALIDGQVLHEGDTVNGVLIVKIYPDQVGFGKDNQTWLQKVGQNPPRQ